MLSTSLRFLKLSKCSTELQTLSNFTLIKNIFYFIYLSRSTNPFWWRFSWKTNGYICNTWSRNCGCNPEVWSSHQSQYPVVEECNIPDGLVFKGRPLENRRLLWDITARYEGIWQPLSRETLSIFPEGYGLQFEQLGR